MNVELCWLITGKCNAHCSFCHRPEGQMDLPAEANLEILQNLIEAGITEFTISGGEALLYDGITELVRAADRAHCRIHLISNGSLPRFLSPDIFTHLYEMTFSLDSTEGTVNEAIGRGKQQFSDLNSAIDLVRKINPDIFLRINSVLSQKTVDGITAVGDYLKEKEIKRWRIGKFAPLRGKAQKNCSLFNISEGLYSDTCDKLRRAFPEISIQTRMGPDYENQYLLIYPGGDIVRTSAGKDTVLGSARNPKEIMKIGGLLSGSENSGNKTATAS